MKLHIQASLFVFTFAFIHAISANASVIYTYTGNNYNSFVSTELVLPQPYDSSMSVSGFIELETEIGANQLIDGHGLVPLDFSFSSGVITIDFTNAGGVFLDFATDASGNITEWNLYFVDDPTGLTLGGELHEIFSTFTTDDIFVGYLDIGETSYCKNLDAQGRCRFSDYHRGISEIPGTWTVSNVPVPAAAWLFGSGLVGLIGVAGRKKQK